MSFHSRLFRSSTAVLGVAALAVAATGARAKSAPAIAQTADASAHRCHVLDGLTEKIVDVSINPLSGPYPAIGDSSTYLTYLYDGSGKHIGTVYGEANIPGHLPNGDVAEYSAETITLPGGTIETEGIYDITLGATGHWQFLPAIGISGDYRGELGKREFLIVKAAAQLEVNIELCEPGASVGG
jgi:hypothetical protein